MLDRYYRLVVSDEPAMWWEFVLKVQAARQCRTLELICLPTYPIFERYL